MILRTSNNMLAIETPVPFGSTIDVWLRLHHVDLAHLVAHSRQYERAYLAWETVRKMRNPFFVEGTGFEGYFVGIHHSAEEMLDKLLEIGHGMLASNCRLYRHQHIFKSRLMKTLTGELGDPQAIAVWSSLLGATLGKLRCNVVANAAIYRFQNETYWTVNRLPSMCYVQHDHSIEQTYVLARFKGQCNSRPSLQLDMLNSSDYDAGLVVSLVGRFGHPLLREYLENICG